MKDSHSKYTMRISRLTIDKLGIHMYDRVSAVLAELIANSYDADAESVTITLPFGKYLARKKEGQIEDQGFEIVIEDNGSGMTVEEINEYYLNVGYNRRTIRSEKTPKHNRKVMGRKGIGKLAPFGICHEVEVVSAGGDLTQYGYLVSNLILNFGRMMEEEVDEEGNIEPYHPGLGELDGTYKEKAGTKLILRHFNRKRVPKGEELDRQLSARFGLSRENWNVRLKDNTGENNPIELGTLKVDVMKGTRIDVSDRPVKVEDQFYPVSGWIAYAKDPYKDEVMAGVRLYARGKIVAQTRDFDIKTGFTGEFKMRSYLTGEIHAEWLDESEDLVRTDRQDIIWNSDFGAALREWGQNLLKELAQKAEVSAGQRVWEVFLEKSKLKERLQIGLPEDAVVRDSVMRAAKLLVTRTDRDSIKDPKYIDRVVEQAYVIGPHSTLLNTLDEVASMPDGSIDAILSLFERARLVEMYSLGQVAHERVEAIEQLCQLVSASDTTEPKLQTLIEKAPWILYPDWTPLSFNQSLSGTRENFESWYLATRHQKIITTTINHQNKRPDFVMLNHQRRLEVIEIKRPQHKLTDDEFSRAFDYLAAVREFIGTNSQVKEIFSDASLTIVCDSLDKLAAIHRNNIHKDHDIIHKTWHDLLQSTIQSHEDFLKVVKIMRGELPKLE